MSKIIIYPKQYKSYTYKEIIEDLYLRDDPSLCFRHQDIGGVIQKAHLTEEELISVPGLAESKWIYIRETHEWIPIFKFDQKVDQPPITTLVDIELYNDKYNLDNGKDWWWATPKGFPRNQHE